jgi:hypothetical protein
VLRITRGALTGKIWILGGELIDAEAEGARGEAAFHRILEWKSGTFENLPAEPDHERTIHKPSHALLLETAQAMDETANPAETGSGEDATHRKTVWRLSALTREGAEWVVALPATGPAEGCGTQSAEEVAAWIRAVNGSCERMGQLLETGPLAYVEAQSLDRRVVLLPSNGRTFLVAWPPQADGERLLEQSKKIMASWDS